MSIKLDENMRPQLKEDIGEGVFRSYMPWPDFSSLRGCNSSMQEDLAEGMFGKPVPLVLSIDGLRKLNSTRTTFEE